jgi:anti-sigma B factor antagonist
MALTLDSHRDGHTVTVTVSGDLDLSTADEFEEVVAGHVLGDAAEVVVDLSDVGFVDSAGINVLLKGRRLADQHGHRFRATRADGLVLEVLELTGVWGHLSTGNA